MKFNKMDIQMSKDIPSSSHGNTDQQSWSKLFHQILDTHSGYVNTLSDAEHLIKTYQLETDSKFCVWNSPKNFGSTAIREERKHKVLFNKDRTAYIVLRNKRYTCEHGTDRHRKDKLRRLENLNTFVDDAKFNTKKKDCQAKILLREVVVFPKYKMVRCSHWEKRVFSCQIREWLDDKLRSLTDLQHERYIHIELPKSTEHNQHSDKIHTEKLHPLIIHKANEIVWNDEDISMKSLCEKIKCFIGGAFPLEIEKRPRRRRYHPSVADLRYIKRKAKKCCLMTAEDRQEIKSLYDSLTSKRVFDKFYICDSIYNQDENETKQTEGYIKNRTGRVFFVLQTCKAQSLLFLYGKQIFFTRLSRQYMFLPYEVFCLYVETNVDFQPVIMFLCQNTNLLLLTDVLELVKSWNKFWKPGHIFLDNEKLQEEAFKTAVPGVSTSINPWRCQQEWLSWLREHTDETTRKILFELMKQMAFASTHENFLAAVEKFNLASASNHSFSLSEWFNTLWLPIHQEWRVPGTTMLNNFRVYDEDVLFKEFHVDVTDMSAPGSWLCITLEKVVHGFDQSYKRYVQFNKELYSMKSQCRMGWGDISYFLPEVQKYLTVQEIDGACASSYFLSYLEFGCYELKNENECLNVSFVSHPPSCDCQEWEKTKLPCQHMFFIFHHVDDWNFDRLPVNYRKSPMFNVDIGCLSTREAVDLSHKTTDDG